MPLETDAPYACPSCFETNYVGIDPTGGKSQRFVEDCPVCCRPLEFLVTIDADGDGFVERVELAE